MTEINRDSLIRAPARPQVSHPECSFGAQEDAGGGMVVGDPTGISGGSLGFELGDLIDLLAISQFLSIPVFSSRQQRLIIAGLINENRPSGVDEGSYLETPCN